MNLSAFQQKIDQAGKPVIVDFWAPWCGPCRMTKPILDRLAREYAGKVEFLPINADDSPEVLKKFNVMGIPTVIAMHGGKVAARITGAQSEENYRQVFAALAEGKEIQIAMNPFDRYLRVGGGLLIVIVGLVTGSWVAAAAGAAIAFLGVYDRCPVWKSLMGMIKRK